jgi:hypothetical protein
VQKRPHVKVSCSLRLAYRFLLQSGVLCSVYSPGSSWLTRRLHCPCYYNPHTVSPLRSFTLVYSIAHEYSLQRVLGGPPTPQRTPPPGQHGPVKIRYGPYIVKTSHENHPSPLFVQRSTTVQWETRRRRFVCCLFGMPLHTTQTHIYTHTDTHPHTRTHTHTHTHTDTHTQTRSHKYTHTQTQTQTHTDRQTRAHTHAHTHTHTHTHTQTRTHTDTHTQAQ